MRPLLSGPAAVNREVGAGDLRRVVTAQKQRERCDLLRRHELPGRLCFQVVDDLFPWSCCAPSWNLALNQRQPDIA